jgi:hypothetical protein
MKGEADVGRLAFLMVLALAAGAASADIIQWDFAPAGEGTFAVSSSQLTQTVPDEFVMAAGCSQYGCPGLAAGNFVTDGTDPTVWIAQTIQNDTTFDWTDYHITIGMTQAFTITGVIAPDNWTWNITAPAAGTGPDGTAGYVGDVDYSVGSGSPIVQGASGDFGLIVHFNGSIAYCTEQIPTPEPATLGLLALAGSALLARRRR